MKRYANMARQTMFSYLNTFISTLLAPVLILVLTRTLSVEDFGVYSLFVVTITMLTIFLEMALSQYILTRLPGMDYKDKITHFFSLYFSEFFILAGIVAVVLLWLEKPILDILGVSAYKPEFRLIIALVFLITLMRLSSANFRANKRIELANMLIIIRQCLWIILLLLTFLAAKKFTLFDVFKLWLFGVVITFALHVFFFRKDLMRFWKIHRLDLHIFRNAFFFSMPLIPFLLGTWTMTAADRYILNYYFGSALVGFYTLAYSLASFISTLGTIVPVTLYPYIAEAWNRKEDYNLLFNISAKWGFILVFPAMVGLFFLRKQIITLISGVEYLQSVPVLSILIFFPFFLFLNFIFGRFLLIQGKTKRIGAIYVAGALINIALNFMLIPPLRMYGAAIATVASYVCVFFMLYFSSKKKISFNYSYLKIPRILTASLIMGTFLYFVNPQVALIKILSIILGAAFYFLLLFALKVFVEKEKELFKMIVTKHRIFLWKGEP
ncbi:polysaccharide biosynthesis C-terminal domain-containing protein [Candidatus Woesearchaeota archaeon]|nr:polysaccharide biosynthesis C-terminal domain-containing protein [Candidatus Woesearchaeota archaeon]